MPENIFFTPSELARETNQGESSVRFWLNRFSPWFIHRIDRGQKQYAKKSIATLLMIAEKIDQGMIPTQIEALLADRTSSGRQQTDTTTNKEQIDETASNSLELIQSILGTITSLQERIATAQERRAGAEEQKARAMEKRAAAEEQKALAMDAIARALGQINHVPSEIKAPKSSLQGDFLLETTRALALDQNFDQDLDQSQDQETEPQPVEPSNKEAIIPDEDYPGLDDLGMLVEEKEASSGIKPVITPEENFEQYKSEIINIIIQLKSQGLSVDETTGRFNDENVLTLSGKPRWSTRAIDQIYRFIDAVKE